MKNFVLILLVMLSATAWGQAHFETPSSPAFTILDFEPASVLRPTSPSELKTNVMSAFDEDGKLKPNIGLEFSPYWLNSHPELTYEQYSDPNPFQSILQTLSISVATRHDTAIDRTIMGVGLKFQPVPGKIQLDAKSQAALQQNLQIIGLAQGVLTFAQAGTVTSRAAGLDILEDGMNTLYGHTVARSYRKKFDALAADYNDTSQSIQDLMNRIITDYNNTAASIDVGRERTGMIIEVAGALKLDPGRNSGEAVAGRGGVWFTISSHSRKQCDWILTGRYLHAAGDTLVANFDVGLSYVRDFDRFNFSLEGVWRNSRAEFEDTNASNETITRVEKDVTYRLAAVLQYSLNELLTVNLSMGKDYDRPFTTNGSFFSVVGVNLNLFKEVTVKK